MTTQQQTTSSLKDFLKKSVPVAEGADSDAVAYRASFASNGLPGDLSGLSFGRMQNDLAGRVLDVWDTFRAILRLNTYFQNDAQKVEDALKAGSTPGVTRSGMPAKLMPEIDAAFKIKAAEPLIDGRDDRRAQELAGELKAQLVNPAVAKVGRGVFDEKHPDYLIALGYVAAWNNRQSDIDKLVNYMLGHERSWGGFNHRLPQGPTLQDVIDYIGTQEQFRPKIILLGARGRSLTFGRIRSRKASLTGSRSWGYRFQLTSLLLSLDPRWSHATFTLPHRYCPNENRQRLGFPVEHPRRRRYRPAHRRRLRRQVHRLRFRLCPGDRRRRVWAAARRRPLCHRLRLVHQTPARCFR